MSLKEKKAKQLAENLAQAICDVLLYRASCEAEVTKAQPVEKNHTRGWIKHSDAAKLINHRTRFVKEWIRKQELKAKDCKGNSYDPSVPARDQPRVWWVTLRDFKTVCRKKGIDISGISNKPT